MIEGGGANQAGKKELNNVCGWSRKETTDKRCTVVEGVSERAACVTPQYATGDRGPK